MHGRQTKRTVSLIQTRVQSRTGATATAAKPVARPQGKWDPHPSSSSSPQPLQPNLAKWARPAEFQPRSSPVPAYLPTGKWAFPEARSQSKPPLANVSREPSSRNGETGRLAQRRIDQPPIGRPNQRNAPSLPGPSFQINPRNSQQAFAPPLRGHTQPGRNGPINNTLARDVAPHQALNANNLFSRRNEELERRLNARRASILKPTSALPPRRQQKAGTHDEEGNVGRPRDNVHTDRLENQDDADHADTPNYIEEEVFATSNNGFRRGVRDQYKTRGSLVSHLKKGNESWAPAYYKNSQGPSQMTQAKIRKRKELLKPATLDVFIPSLISVGNLSRLLNVRLETLQRRMMKVGMENESSYDHMLSSDYASVLALDFNRNPVVDDEAAFDIYPPHPHPNPTTLPHRPPIVTIMGHVDHGKTTLLDTLRSTSVAKGEAGGITQHIGAFSVPVPNSSDSPDTPRSITFLDTPGHAAFSAMRARGAQVTDIIVLVVAADDGVKPQTKEVIDLIQKDGGKTGVVVAINKVDKPGIDIENVQRALWAEGLQLEALGGDIPSVEVSGLTGAGLDSLVETISALAEIQDIRAETDSNVHGYILESQMKKGHGASATVLLLRGTLTHSSHIISGTSYAKVRQLTDSTGNTVETVLPGTAVTVSGWKGLPQAGDEVLLGTESDVKKAVHNRVRKARLEATLEDAEAINERRRLDRENEKEEELASMAEPVTTAGQKQENKPKELRLVIKGDVTGSVEAVTSAVSVIGNQHAVVKVISTGVGDVTESDVMMAKAAEGMIIAFSVNIPRPAKFAAAQNQVPIHSSSIIYELMDEVKLRIVPLLPLITVKRVTGEANVLQLFDIRLKGKKILKVAGCRVSNGVVEIGRSARVVRNGVTVHEGPLRTLRNLKRDVSEVKKGSECGVSFEKFEDLREGDLVQVLQVIEKPGTL